MPGVHQLIAHELSIDFGQSRVLGPWSAQFRAGARIGFVGPVGSGKSTLLSILGGHRPPVPGLRLHGRVDAPRSCRRIAVRPARLMPEDLSLSGAQARQTELERALICRPELLLVDEPGHPAATLEPRGLEGVPFVFSASTSIASLAGWANEFWQLVPAGSPVRLA